MRWLTLALLVGCSDPSKRLDPGPFEGLEPTAERQVSAEARGYVLRARAAEERGDLEEAERALGWVLRLERKEPASFVLWGRYLQRQGRTKEAVEAFAQALELDPNWAPAHLYLGDLMVRGDHFDRAAIHLLAAIDGGELEGFEVLARLYQRTERLDELAELVERWMQEPMVSADERLRRAQSALSAGMASEAVDDLVQVLAERDDPLIGELLVEAAARGCRLGTAWNTAERLRLHEDQDYAQAMARLSRAVAAPDSSFEGEEELIRGALAMVAQGRAESALELLAEGRKRGLSQSLWLARGLAHGALGATGPALAAVERATGGTEAPQVDTRFTDVESATIEDQAAELRAHLLIDAGEQPEDLPASAAMRLSVRAGGEVSGSPRLRTALLLDAGRVDEAVESAVDLESRRLLANHRPELLRGEPAACDGPFLSALSAGLDPCDALSWQIRAWEAAPLLADLDLPASHLACDAASSPGTAP